MMLKRVGVGLTAKLSMMNVPLTSDTNSLNLTEARHPKLELVSVQYTPTSSA